MSAGYTALEQEIAAWEGVSAEPHRFGGIEFQWGGVEIGHIHRSGMTDIPFTRRIREALVAAQITQPHHLLPETGWITFYMRTPQDQQTVRTLMRLSYLQKRRRRMPAEQFAAEMAALPLPEAVKQAAGGSIETEE